MPEGEYNMDELPELAHRVYQLVSTGTVTDWSNLDPDVQSWWRRVALAIVGTVVSKGAGFGGFTVTIGGSRLMAVDQSAVDGGLTLHVYPPWLKPPHVLSTDAVAEYFRQRGKLIGMMESKRQVFKSLSDPDWETVCRFLAIADDCIGLKDETEGVF